MPIPVVAFDEAGNTGPNLLDSAQPCFALASVHLSDEEASTILEPVTGRQTKEAHFASLKRRQAGREGILKLLASPLLTEDKAKIYVIHKPYMVVTKLVDLLPENLLYRQGIDLYHKGGNIALANVLYFCIPALCSKTQFLRLQQSFVCMIRSKTGTAISDFYAAVNEAERKCRNSELVPILGLLAATRGIVQYQLDRCSHTELDPAITSLLQLSAIWSDQLAQPFSIIHDHSKSVDFDKDLVEALMDPSGPNIRVGRDRRDAPLFIKATGVSFVNSRDSKQIQVADILAGAASYLFNGHTRGPVDPEFCQEVKEVFPLELISGAMLPTPDVTPEELGTDIDFTGENEGRIGAEIFKRIYIDSRGRPRKSGKQEAESPRPH